MKLPQKKHYNYQTDNAKEKRMFWLSLVIGILIVAILYVFL